MRTGGLRGVEPGAVERVRARASARLKKKKSLYASESRELSGCWGHTLQVRRRLRAQGCRHINS